MSAEPLDGLLEKLNAGDASAAEQVFRTYEPYLHMLVRRQLRAPLRSKFDSLDVVQSVWADLIEGVQDAGWHFTDRAQLQAFLVRLARNRFIDRYRKHRTAVSREEPLMDSSRADSVVDDTPRPSEIAQRNELWDQMLALCPPAHHELLRSKRQGMALADIAARTGLHESSVRRILYDLAKKVAAAREASEVIEEDSR